MSDSLDMRLRLSYTRKAEKYARYRWAYAAPAIQAIVEAAQVNVQSWVADVGAGTGILSQPFAARGVRLFALEPDLAMLACAQRTLAAYPTAACIAAWAEALPLPDHCLDLLLVGQAIHWFEPESARREFQRVLKPGGWLAIVWNHPIDSTLNQAMGVLFTAGNGWDATASTSARPPAPPLNFFFGGEHYQSFTYSAQREESWEQFMGALGSDSHAPDEDHPLYSCLEGAARKVFDQHCHAGVVTVHFATELGLGQLY
jgi:ubiquinone/menaquinone biosynthesis C-methylase UbiE